MCLDPGSSTPDPVGHDVGEAAAETPELLRFATVERDAFRIFPEAHQPEAEIGLEPLLGDL